MKALNARTGRKGLVSVVLLLFFEIASHVVLGYAPMWRRALATSRSIAPLFSTLSNTNNVTSTIPSNQELVHRRLAVSRAKKQSRQRSLQETHERNLVWKRMLHNATATFVEQPLYAVKVFVCEELRQDLRLNGREKRGRVFIQTDGEACQSLAALKQEMHSFFRFLRKSTYVLHASLPTGTYTCTACVDTLAAKTDFVLTTTTCVCSCSGWVYRSAIGEQGKCHKVAD